MRTSAVCGTGDAADPVANDHRNDGIVLERKD
jgi:hypothetical protein